MKTTATATVQSTATAAALALSVHRPRRARQPSPPRFAGSQDSRRHRPHLCRDSGRPSGALCGHLCKDSEPRPPCYRLDASHLQQRAPYLSRRASRPRCRGQMDGPPPHRDKYPTFCPRFRFRPGDLFFRSYRLNNPTTPPPVIVPEIIYRFSKNHKTKIRNYEYYSNNNRNR